MFHGDTPIYQNLVCLWWSCQALIHGENIYNFYWGQRSRPYRGHEMYTTHCTMLIHSCAKHRRTKKAVARTQSGMPMSKQTEETTKTYKVDIKVKGQCWIGIMNVRNTSSYGDKRVYVKSKKFLPATKICQKPCKFDLEVKGQRCIGITNIHIVSWYIYVPNMVGQSQTKKIYGPDMNLHRQTDRQTDGQTKWFLYTPSPWRLLTMY